MYLEGVKSQKLQKCGFWSALPSKQVFIAVAKVLQYATGSSYSAPQEETEKHIFQHSVHLFCDRT